MPAIGYVAKDENGSFKGQLRTLSIRAEISVVPNARKRNDVQPDYRVVSGDVEIGAGWLRRSEASGRDYVSLSLAAPEFGPRRLYANLAQAADDRDDRFVILWNPAD
jgi:uncharacterized protein (DUF736 family)